MGLHFEEMLLLFKQKKELWRSELLAQADGGRREGLMVK